MRVKFLIFFNIIRIKILKEGRNQLDTMENILDLIMLHFGYQMQNKLLFGIVQEWVLK